MAIPLRGHDPETHGHCVKLLKDVFDSVNAGATLSHKVRAILQENLHLDLNIAAVAERLCCSTRTLNRKLDKEDLNFTDLSVAVRLESIQNLLATTHLGSKAVAGRVGFSDVRSLRRFFKSQTGRTIRQFREETLG
jgi:AraC-like DNA-binding protein